MRRVLWGALKFNAGLLAAVTLFTQLASGQTQKLSQGWMEEFDLAARHLVALAEAIPAEKYSWRPGPGVRSTSEVFVHIAYGNYWLTAQAGGKIPDGTPDIPPDLEKKVTAKADVLRWLKNSMDTVKQAYPATDRTKTVRFLGRDTTSEAVFLRLLVHNHEHMGQSVAYARMMGVVPPWSKPSSK